MGKKRLILVLKTYFLILNLLFSTIALSNIINAQDNTAGQQLPPGVSVLNGGGTGQPPMTPPPGSSNTATGGTSQPPTTGGGPVPPPPGDNGGEDNFNDGDNSNGGRFLSFNFQSIVMKAGIGASMFGTLGTLAGGDNGAAWGSFAGAVGGVVAAITEESLGTVGSSLLGLGVAALIFILTYKKASTEIVEFHCLPWEAPIGGDNCELCNDYGECSEYTCKSLGQACEIVNAGSDEQRCIWKNPHDVNSPIITVTNITKGYKFKPNTAIRPPATGIKVVDEKGKDTCIKAFTPLEFSFDTDEPGQCKIDYNLTKGYEEMSFYVGGSTMYSYNHTEKFSLPSPGAINAVNPEIKNDGDYILYMRCQDANGNFNQDAFSISFCVEKGPDLTPPRIESASIPSGKPIQFNQSKLALEIYVNEPSECKWSREDRSYSNMEYKMDCDTNVWEMNNNLVYTCRTTLKGLESRKTNEFYFKCKDQPYAEEKDRNVNVQSYLYKVIGTQPLNIMGIGPNGTISGATDYIPVFLQISTDNGYNNGESICYFSNKKPTKNEDYVQFLDTGKNNHKQRQDLPTGEYKYYFKCVDLGGNTAYNTTQFKVLSDKNPSTIVRVYKEGENMKVITDDISECTYSTQNCNFEIESGIKMESDDGEKHFAEWRNNQLYYIRCRDRYNNQPNPNSCSIVVRAYKMDDKVDTLEFPEE
ncbi:MAG: hypothetical protein WC867_02570 [Candidatus Pacearchaeota archaeon]|jgi:hypothetical protein